MSIKKPSNLRRMSIAACLLATTLLLTTNVLAKMNAKRGIQIEANTKLNHPLATGTYRALIIGNNDYLDPENLWAPLKTAVSDSRSVASVLTNDYGFTDVTLLENASRRDILLALRNLTDRVQPNDSVLLYYAGHGFLDEDNNKGYWVPVDAVGTDHTTFVRNSTIRDELSIIAERAKHTLLLSDSCFSGTLLRDGNRGAVDKDDSYSYYEKIAQKRSAQIIAAGGIEYVDDDYRSSGHSPFTYFLLSELTLNNNPILTATELGANVSKAVANNVNQVPESGVLYGAGDELGEFLFIKVNIDTTSKANETVVEIKVQQPQSTREVRDVEKDPEPKPEKLSDAMVPMPTL
ncbi:caspase family protein [Reinekea marina]|uniref:Caspase domain-containing protein n=1 Tax=Reinekea marina TaxID=1310421 RepID=A0ABV7WY55_9GAMM|nr:caspase family protein [Reinekea marina]MDN3647439.1 caspase family protein [Reinekea marina]